LSHSLHVILRCNTTHPANQMIADGHPTPCDGYWIAPRNTSVPAARDLAAQKGWSFKPGKPYRHIGARDYCPRCTKKDH
jgi:hypothetical protein